MNDQPMNETVEAAPVTVDSAAALLSKAMNQELVRAPNGQFAAKDSAETVETENTEEPAKVVDLKTGKPAEAKKAEEPAVEDEDLEFELPADKDGEQPKRLKLSQLYEGFEKASVLEKELEETKARFSTVPEEYQTQVRATMETRSKYMESLRVMENFINPRQPPTDMLNPASQNYNPDAYYDAMQRFERDTKALSAIKTDMQRMERAQAEEQSVLMKAHVAREAEALHRAWPEAKNPETLKSVAKALVKDYGFSNEDIENISDHRQLLVIRDALELRALKAKQADAVKVVRAKPKLVKGAARSSTAPNEAAKANAMTRLSQTGSIDAAAAALKALKL